MQSLELKAINIKSMLKNLPVVFIGVGILIGFFTFFLFPTEIARTLSVGARFLAWLIFVVLYALIMVLGLMIISLLYKRRRWKDGRSGIPSLTRKKINYRHYRFFSVNGSSILPVAVFACGPRVTHSFALKRE